MIPANIRTKLPAVFLGALNELNESCNASDEAIFNMLLGAMNTPIQAIANINPVVSPVDWKKSALTLFLMTFMDSGAKKSHIGNTANIGAKEYQKMDKARYDDDKKRYQLDKKDYDDAMKSKSPPNPFPSEPTPPINFRSIFTTATTNGIKVALTNKGYAAIHNFDALEFFSGHSWQEKNGGGSEMASMLSNAWSGETIETNTGVIENNVYLPNRRMSLSLAMQSKVADIYNNTKLRRQGFLNRFLTLQAVKMPPVELTEEILKERETKAATLGNKTALDKFADRLYQLYEKADAIQMAAHSIPTNKLKYDPYELILETLDFEDDGSKKLLVEFYNKCQKMTTDEKYEDYVEFITRLYEQAIRLAGNYALIEGLDKVNLQFTECGIVTAEWYLEQLIGLTDIGQCSMSPVVDATEKIYKKFLQALPSGTKVIKSDFYKNGCQHIWKSLEVQKRNAVIQQCISNDWLTVNLDTGEMVKV